MCLRFAAGSKSAVRFAGYDPISQKFAGVRVGPSGVAKGQDGVLVTAARPALELFPYSGRCVSSDSVIDDKYAWDLDGRFSGLAIDGDPQQVDAHGRRYSRDTFLGAKVNEAPPSGLYNVVPIVLSSADFFGIEGPQYPFSPQTAKASVWYCTVSPLYDNDELFVHYGDAYEPLRVAGQYSSAPSGQYGPHKATAKSARVTVLRWLNDTRIMALWSSSLKQVVPTGTFRQRRERGLAAVTTGSVVAVCHRHHLRGASLPGSVYFVWRKAIVLKRVGERHEGRWNGLFVDDDNLEQRKKGGVKAQRLQPIELARADFLAAGSPARIPRVPGSIAASVGKWFIIS